MKIFSKITGRLYKNKRKYWKNMHRQNQLTNTCKESRIERAHQQNGRRYRMIKLARDKSPIGKRNTG